MSHDNAAPYLIAAVDQYRAHLHELVDSARRHLPHCPYPPVLACPGDAVIHRLEQHTSRATIELLLGLAIGELATAATGTGDTTTTTIEGIST